MSALTLLRVAKTLRKVGFTDENESAEWQVPRRGAKKGCLQIVEALGFCIARFF